METYIVVEYRMDGTTRVLKGSYIWDEACEVQEAMEVIHPWNAYLIFTPDEWARERESGRA